MRDPAVDRPIAFIPKTYKEEQLQLSAKHSTIFLKHTLELNFQRPPFTWRVRVTLQAAWAKNTTLLQRKQAVQTACRHIRFDRLHLFRDTVTEVVLSSEHDIATIRKLPLEQPNADKAEFRLDNRWYYTREDPSRICYPSFDFDASMTAVRLSDITKENKLAAGVHTVYHNHPLYVYKEIDRALYELSDTAILVQELCNLRLLRRSQYIVRLVGVVVSSNPYRTADTDGSLVLRGLLLDYHPNGTLADALQAADRSGGRPWRRWALQIALGLAELHCNSLAHMDLKPSNVVISVDGNAVLIDVSGRAFTQEWLRPRCVTSTRPPRKVWKHEYGVWAFGEQLLHMSSKSSDDMPARRTTRKKTRSRARARATATPSVDEPELQRLGR
ncbi:kinase-like domain-containing protein [Coniochaeta sp. 2T2.1]|nr:kinase-like domain-containing protein [Coniochaeta sp. 2T2.1]